MLKRTAQLIDSFCIIEQISWGPVDRWRTLATCDWRAYLILVMGAILHSNSDKNCCLVRNPDWFIYMGYAIIGIFHSCWMLWNVTLSDHQWPWSSATYPWTRPLFCSCWSRIFSSFRGLGMNPISQPSFTNRPIHQSLLNFCAKQQKYQKEFSNFFIKW